MHLTQVGRGNGDWVRWDPERETDVDSGHVRVEVLAGRSDHSIELYVHCCFIESSSSQPVSCLNVKRPHYSEHRQISRGGVVTACLRSLAGDVFEQSNIFTDGGTVFSYPLAVG